jgi:phospholipid/cholesterol/gamma-HCH transport system permease protein
MLMFPVVIVLASAFGILWGWAASLTLLDMSSAEFVRGLRLSFEPWDVQYAAIKSMSFGLIVTGVGSFYGFHAKGGAGGVGVATTRAVVVSSMLILVLDAFWAMVLL